MSGFFPRAVIKSEKVKQQSKLSTEQSQAYGKFFARGGGKPFAQKNLASCPNFYERVEKKWEPYCNNIGRPGIWRGLDTVFQGQYEVWA